MTHIFFISHVTDVSDIATPNLSPLVGGLSGRAKHDELIIACSEKAMIDDQCQSIVLDTSHAISHYETFSPEMAGIAQLTMFLVKGWVMTPFGDRNHFGILWQ